MKPNYIGNNLEQGWEAIEAICRIEKFNAPLNRDEEYRKVCEGYQQEQAYNPQFAYQPPPEYPVARIRTFRARLDRKNRLTCLYEQKARDALLAIEATQTHAPELITASSCLVNGLLDTGLLSEAWRILREVSSEESSEPEDIPGTGCGPHANSD